MIQFILFNRIELRTKAKKTKKKTTTRLGYEIITITFFHARVNDVRVGIENGLHHPILMVEGKTLCKTFIIKREPYKYPETTELID